MAATTSNKPLPGTETVVKQEKLDDSHIEIGEIQTEGFPPFQGTFKFAEEEAAGPSEQIDEPPPKRARRAAATRKPVQMSPETDEEDDVEALEAVTKVEDESESEGEAGDDGTGEVDEPEPAFVDVPSASIVDDQPGPSGLGKDGVVPPDDKIKLEDILDDPSYIPNSNTRRPRKSSKPKRLKRYPPSTSPTPDHTFKYIETLKKYICNTCSEGFPSEDLIKDHIATEHNYKYACETCPEVFNTAFCFALHMKTHSKEKEFACPLCSHTTTNSHCLRIHINRIHFHKFPLYCELCGQGFSYQTLLDGHLKRHKGILSENCVVCQKEYTTTKYLLMHQIKHHTVPIEGVKRLNQCEFCPKVFRYPIYLQKHLKEKHGDKPPKVPQRHLCDICGKDFTYRKKLVVHYRIHTGVKPYSCKYCQKTFSKKDYLVVHERIHTGEKPYLCTTCGRSFNQSASFRTHLRTHSGERPFNCVACNTGFISKGSLDLHRKFCQEIVE